MLNLPKAIGIWVKLNNAPIFVDAVLDENGIANGEFHNIIAESGDVITWDEENSIADDLLRGKFYIHS